jgi:hypothetical protein
MRLSRKHSMEFICAAATCWFVLIAATIPTVLLQSPYWYPIFALLLASGLSPWLEPRTLSHRALLSAYWFLAECLAWLYVSIQSYNAVPFQLTYMALSACIPMALMWFDWIPYVYVPGAILGTIISPLVVISIFAVSWNPPVPPHFRLTAPDRSAKIHLVKEISSDGITTIAYWKQSSSWNWTPAVTLNNCNLQTAKGNWHPSTQTVSLHLGGPGCPANSISIPNWKPRRQP